MTNFLGEYNCKLDAKGRFLLPASFKKNLSGEGQERFVIKKHIYEKCLLLYPMAEWEKVVEALNKKTNSFNKSHSKFKRAFFRGLVDLNIDSASRLLIPKRLLEEVGISNEAVLLGQNELIEIWDPQCYDESMLSQEEYASLGESLFGGQSDDAEN